MKKTVIVCDDDQGILEVIKIILEEKGHRVIALSNGAEIENTIEKNPPDMLLLDLWMPIVDGREITRKLKQNSKTKNIPIIVISALNDTEKIAKEVGANDFLPKPFDIEELSKIVERNMKTLKR